MTGPLSWLSSLFSFGGHPVYAKLLKASGAAERLSDCLTWLDFVEHRGQDYVLLQNGNLLGLAEILSCESQLASDQQLNEIRNDLHAVTQNLSPDYSLSIHFTRRRAEPIRFPADSAAPPIIQDLRRSEEEFWEKRRPRMYENRNFIALEGRTGALTDSWLRGLLFGWRHFDHRRFQESKESFHNVFRGILDNMAGFARVRPLDRDGVLRLFHHFLNPVQSQRTGPVSYNPAYTIPEQVCDAGFNDAGPDLIREDNGTAPPSTHFRVLNLDMLPAISYPTTFDSLTRLGSSRPDETVSPYWITQHYQPLDPDSFLTTLNIKQNFGGSLKNVQFLKNIAQKSIDLAADAADVTNAIQRDKEGAGYFSMFCVVYDTDLSRLESTCNRLLTDARAKNARFIVESQFARFASFLSSLPGHSGLSTQRLLNYRRARIINANFADFAMVHKDDEGDPEGPIVFETPEGGIFRVDLFSPRSTSHNAYFAGTTGGGKSYTMNHILANALTKRPILYILDIGNSYDPLVQSYPGAVKITVDFTNPDLRLNPFSFAETPNQGERVSLSHLLEHMITGGQVQLTQGDRVDLMDALDRLFEAYDPSDPPTLQDYYRMLESIDPGLAKPLRLWIPGGPYQAFFNSKTDSFQSADLVYFELTGFDDHPDVASAITFLLFTKIFQRLQRPQDRGRNKIIVLDECWKFLMNDVMASKITELYRTVRKHAGAIHTITQHPNDLINSKHRDAILANTAFTFMLEQKGVGEEAREAFALNPREFFVMKSIRLKTGQYAELLIKGPYKRQVRVRVDPFSHALFSTDPADRDMRWTLAELLGSVEAAVRAMADGSARKLIEAAKRYPSVQEAARALRDGDPNELTQIP